MNIATVQEVITTGSDFTQLRANKQIDKLSNYLLWTKNI